MSGQKPFARFLPKDLQCPIRNCRLGAGSPGASLPIKSIIARTGVASSTNSLPRTASTGDVNPTSITPRIFARFNTGCRSHPTIRPANLRFRNASANDPPISPVPIMVICRIGIKRIE
jgi:hypothetical protein